MTMSQPPALYPADSAPTPDAVDFALTCLESEGYLTDFMDACGQAILDWSGNGDTSLQCPPACSDLLYKTVSSASQVFACHGTV